MVGLLYILRKLLFIMNSSIIAIDKGYRSAIALTSELLGR